ncbi:MAG TPA: PPC domain-containing protein [Polyangia bacterium]|nr:PPC domain-containing protein [Polyangia bacterium]
MRFAFGLSLMLVAGCGQSMGTSGDDLGRPLPDGFLQTKCMMNDDCDDGNPCTMDTCSQAQGCLHTAKNCTGAGDACNNGYCDTGTGNCLSMPANENLSCVDNSGQPGNCSMGTCLPLPQCQVDVNTFLDCSSFSNTVSGSTLGPSIINTYACASGLTGAEHAYPFNVFSDQTVTATLTNVVAGNDLELVVLDGASCVASATCEGTSVGIPGKSVTWHASSGSSYLIVVDGVNGAAGSFTLSVDCSTCKPIKTLDCNMSASGDTSGTSATKINASYGCAIVPLENGPEDVYRLTPAATTNYKIKLLNQTTDLDLIAFDEYSGQCYPSYCEAASVNGSTVDESLKLLGYSGNVYDVAVDSQMTGGPYTLEVDCPPSCVGSLNFSCNNPSDARRNDSVGVASNVIDNWACDANTTGPEVVYQFYPTVTGSYTFTLSGLTADLDLIVVAGGSSTCDSSDTCVAQSVTAGTANESVTFTANAFNYYYIAVDGKNGAVSPYTLKLSSTLCPGPSCYNGVNQWSCSYLEDTRRNDDPTRSKIAVDNWACDANTTGPEVVYPFVAPATGAYNLTLDGLTDNLDLIVLGGSSGVCASTSACLQSSTNPGTASESLTLNATAGGYYYIAVDGVNGATSPYHLKMTSASCPAAICRNGSMDLTCASLSVSNSNDAFGSTSDVTSWGACDTGTTGPEFAHLFVPPSPGTYTIKMIGLHQDLDLIVQETSAAAPTCSTSAACFASSTNAGTADESVTFTTNAGKAYWIIVDGKNGAAGRYTLALTDGCP